MTTTSTFNATGGQQQFTVPDQVTSITATLIGGKGGGGANGGKVKATFTVTPGQVLYLYVGGNGSTATGSVDASGGFNGGGKGLHATGYTSNTAGSGGGATDIRLGGTTLASRIFVAGGGGGRGCTSSNGSGGAGGSGGANTGGAGSNGQQSVAPFTGGGGGGAGGTQAAGGAVGSTGNGTQNATPGASGNGGNGGTYSFVNGLGATVVYAPGGGAGGGYFGGGGGGSGNNAGGGGGAGGSNFLAATVNGVAPTSTTNTAGDAGTPSIVLTYNTKPVVTAGLPTSTAGLPNTSTTGAFTWTHTDDDAGLPSAYQIVIENNSTGVSLLDTGKVTSTATTATLNISSLPSDVDLRWKVRTWDSTNLVSDYTAYTIFQYGTPPTWTMNPANGSTISQGTPTVDWSTAVATVRNPASYFVTIANASSTVIASTSGTNFSTVTQFTTPSPILTNGQTYTITVKLTDSGGISRTQVATVTATFSQPSALAYTVVPDSAQANGYILIDWTTANSDTAWTKWHVWRKLTSDTDWTLLYETTNQSQRQFQDWLVISGATYQYTVTQVKIVSGQEVESAIGYLNTGLDTNTYSVWYDNYWIIDTINGVFSTYLPSVTSADISDEFEEQTYQIIGRGRKVDYGDRLGYTGTLSCQLRGYDGTPELIRAKLEGLKLAQDTCYLRSPFGDLFQVSLGTIQFSLLAGTGSVSMYDVSIPYQEVSGDIVEEVSMPIDVSVIDNGNGTSTLTISDLTAGVTFTDDNLTIVSF